jgi:hypothetical protein
MSGPIPADREHSVRRLKYDSDATNVSGADVPCDCPAPGYVRNPGYGRTDPLAKIQYQTSQQLYPDASTGRSYPGIRRRLSESTTLKIRSENAATVPQSIVRPHIASNEKTPALLGLVTSRDFSQRRQVAGAGFEPTTSRL